MILPVQSLSVLPCRSSRPDLSTTGPWFRPVRAESGSSAAGGSRHSTGDPGLVRRSRTKRISASGLSMSTYIQIACPSCETDLHVREEYLGKRGACKFCRHVFRIPRNLRIPCPGCHSVLKVSRLYAGRKIDCPTCKRRFVAQVHEATSSRAGKLSVVAETRRDIRDWSVVSDAVQIPRPRVAPETEAAAPFEERCEQIARENSESSEPPRTERGRCRTPPGPGAGARGPTRRGDRSARRGRRRLQTARRHLDRARATHRRPDRPAGREAERLLAAPSGEREDRFAELTNQLAERERQVEELKAVRQHLEETLAAAVEDAEAQRSGTTPAENVNEATDRGDRLLDESRDG